MSLFDTIGQTLGLAGGLACALAAAVVWHRRRRLAAPMASLVLLIATGLWSFVAGLYGHAANFAQLAEVARNLAIFALILSIIQRAGPQDGLEAAKWPLAVLSILEASQLLFQFQLLRATDPHVIAGVQQVALGFRSLVAIGALVLLHNVFVTLVEGRRLRLRWPLIGLAAVWIYDLNFYVTALLIAEVSPLVGALRGAVGCVVAVLFAYSAVGGEDLRLRPSRIAAFQSLSLIGVGCYLLLMIGAAQWLGYAGGDIGSLAAVGLVFAMVTFALIAIPSERVRRWLKVMTVKHLFQHRYDYREEWLRFNRTLGRADSEGETLEIRVVRAVADVVDAPCGGLFAADGEGELQLAGEWNWPPQGDTPGRISAALASALERSARIVDLDEVRSDSNAPLAAVIPAWLLDDPALSAVVPLIHQDRLMGAVVTGRPPIARRLDWEDFDLLRVVGSQSASYLADHASQEALLEVRRFDEFNRRIAFVMHDIKNLASQMALLARNAERHAEKPEFRADMLVTLRNSSERLNALIARLSRYGTQNVKVEPIDAGTLLQSVAAAYSSQHPVLVTHVAKGRVAADQELLEHVLRHLVQNAIDATEGDLPITLSLGVERLTATIEVSDHGCGMTPEFVRNDLFKPFVSSKSGGFGIGAYEAREHVKAMGGSLDVISRQGAGTRFFVRLPLSLDRSATSVARDTTVPTQREEAA